MIVVQLATGDVLLLILQRYYFESESQHVVVLLILSLRCCLSYKDTILKANHSQSRLGSLVVTAVAYPTKILFWKRITAYALVIMFAFSCCLSYKDTILKANHSTRLLQILSIVLLLILQRYYFESESQLFGLLHAIGLAVAYPTKILFWKRITAE